MKLNQATAAVAFLSVSTATLASSSAASTSSYDELKDKVEPLLASRPKHYLHRMLQGFSDECFADWLDTESYPASNDVSCPEALTVVGDTVTMDFNACDASFREACTADNGAFVENNWGDIVIDCTMVTGGSVKYILKYPFECVATSCVSEWKSAEGQVPDEILKELEIKVCAGAAGEGSAAGSSSAGEATTGAGAAESLAAGSSAGKATGTGMLALAATSAAAALFIF